MLLCIIALSFGGERNLKVELKNEKRSYFCFYCFEYLIKELLCAPEDVFELGKFQKVLLQGFLVSVDLLQLDLQLLKCGLQEGGKKHVKHR